MCEALAVQAAAVTDKLRAAATKAKPLSEVAIMDALDRLVAPAREEGEWISTIDLVEDGTRLRVVAQGGPGKCGAECKTVAMAAADVLDSVDTDLAEALWAGRLQGEAAVVDWLCRTATDACRAAPPPPAPHPPAGGSVRARGRADRPDAAHHGVAQGHGDERHAVRPQQRVK